MKVEGVKDLASLKSLKQKLKAIDGVASVEFDDENNTVTITMKRGCSLAEENVTKALKDSDFKVSEFTVSQ
jgi:copper chaperone CopZ